MRLIFASLALASATLYAPMAAAQNSSISAGMQVVDTNGGVVGVVTGLKDGHIQVRTDRHEVSVPTASFTPHEGKLMFGMTQAELNAATDKSLADAAAAIAPGAEVRSSSGSVVGSIEEADDEFVTIKLQSGSLVRMPRSGVAADANGPVIGLTADQLEAQVGSGSSGAQ